MAIYKTLVEKISIPADGKTKQKEYLTAGKVAIVDQGQKLIGGYTDDANKKLECELPVIIFGDHTRTVKYVNFPFGAGADGIKVLKPKKNILPKYLYYGTIYLTLKMPDKGYARHYQFLEKMDLIVPTIEEQKRVVYRIEKLISILDDGILSLKRTEEQLRMYRQAVITAAFPTLTEDNAKKLSDIADVSSGITKGRKLSGQSTITLPYLRVANVQNGYLDLSEIKEIELKESEKERFLLRYDDVLYTEGGDRDKLGRGTVWRNEIPNCVHQNHVFKARVNREFAIPQYVAMWSMATPARNYFYYKGKQSVNLASINKTVLVNLELPIPSLEEQQKTLDVIEEKLSVCDSIQKTIDNALIQAEAMRSSILKKAFEGKM